MDSRAQRERRILTPRTFLELREDLELGRFTPFLGAGASSLWPLKLDAQETPWREILRAIQVIGRSLAETGARAYLRSFTQLYLALDSQQAARIVPNRTPSKRPAAAPATEATWQSARLLNLHISLVKLTACLGDLFGSAFSLTHSLLSQQRLRLQTLAYEQADHACAVAAATLRHGSGGTGSRDLPASWRSCWASADSRSGACRTARCGVSYLRKATLARRRANDHQYAGVPQVGGIACTVAKPMATLRIGKRSLC